MFEKLGIVTNIWTKRLEAGDRFEDLVEIFYKNGFRYMELRDSDEFRNNEFGQFLQAIETAMEGYTDAQWKAICDGRDRLKTSADRYDAKDRELFHRVADFAALTKDIVFTYAIPHAWMTAPDAIAADDRRVIRAKKLAYLLCPTDARLRFVDPEFDGPVAEAETIANLKRYKDLLHDFPMVLCVENALLPATLTLNLAVKGGVLLAYDEANIYAEDGEPLNPPAQFWDAVSIETLACVHIKQKTADGVSPVIGDGYVDFKNILNHLKAAGYTGDLLFENAPSNRSLEDTLRSRDYLQSV
jgi:sugar phosphate isomerase/epimerase